MPRVSLVALAVAMMVAACGGNGEERRSLDIGYAFGADVGDVGDVLALRDVEKRGITVRTRDMGGPSEAVVGLTRGDVDIAQVPVAQLQDAISAGAPVKAVLGQNMTSEIVLVGGPGMTTMEDLAGKTVAASVAKGVGDSLITGALDAASMSRRDVKVVYVDESPSRAAAFAAGRVDAATLDYVDYELLRRREPGKYTILDTAAERLPKVPALVWVVDSGWAEGNDALLRDFVDGLVAGYERVYTAEGRKAWIEESKSSFLAGEPDEMIERLYRFYRELPLWPTRGNATTRAQHDEATRWWLDTGQIAEAVSFEDSWLPDYWAGAAGAD